MNALFRAKEVSIAPSGSTVIILQDDSNSFHVSVSSGSYVIYEHLINPSSMEELRSATTNLEVELLALAT